MDISDPRQDPLGDIVARVPDNIRAEIIRRRTDAIAVAALIHLPYSTFKRRMGKPGDLTIRDLVNLATVLKVPVLAPLRDRWEAPR
jgi:voltage-gated potassium channel Kch